jgi:hypothetical protein
VLLEKILFCEGEKRYERQGGKGMRMKEFARRREEVFRNKS